MKQAEARLVTGMLVEEEEPSSTKGCCCFCCCNDLASCVYNQALCMIVLMQSVIFYMLVTKCDSCEEREKASFFDKVIATKIGCYLRPIAFSFAVSMSTAMTFAAESLRRAVLDRKPWNFRYYMALFPIMVGGYGCQLVLLGMAAVEYVAPLQVEDYALVDPSERVISPSEVVALVVLALLLLLAAGLYCMVNVWSLYKVYRNPPQAVEHFYYIG